MAQRWDWAPPASGFIAGTVGVLVSHPFDTIKTRIQAGWTGKHGVLHITLQEQGIRGLYRGILPPLLHAGIIQGFSFTIFQQAKDHLTGHVSYPAFVAGILSGCIPSFFLLPGYFVKVQLQNEKSRKGTSTISFCTTLVKQHGFGPVFRAMYGRAFLVSFLADALGRGFYFGTYDFLKRNLCSSDNTISLPRRILAASCSGIAGWTSMYYLDTLRSCIMTGAIVGNKTTALDVARNMYAEGGLQAFFRGYHVTVIRAMPVAACVLTVYDLVYERLKTYELQQRERTYDPHRPNPSVAQPPTVVGPSFE